MFVSLSKIFDRRISVTSTWKGLPILFRTLSSKRPLNDQNVDNLKSNPYFGKYAAKIKELKEASPEELHNRLAALFDKSNVAKNNFFQTQTKKLEDIMHVEHLKEKSADEVKFIWENFHHGAHKFATSISSEVYDKLEMRGELYPTFLFPLPRVKGFEYIISQFSGQEVHFSPLINYQMFKENAPECLALTHYTDIAETTKLVLVLGEFNTDVLNVTEALCLYHQLQRYYGEDDPKRLRMIEQFTHSPFDFLHIDLIAELESLQLK